MHWSAASYSHGPDCACLGCALQEQEILKEEYLRSKATKTVDVSKLIGIGTPLPPFLGLIHRHFEKARPAVNGKKATLNAPVDLIDMIVPEDMLKDIESIEIVYEDD
jgi:hypothetical protein